MSELGIEWVRITLNWYEVERKKGEYDWSGPDSVLQRGLGQKLKIYLMIYGTPSWANDGRSEKYPPKNSEDWANFVRAAVTRYREIKVFGMWNEPNVDRFWAGNRDEYIRKILIPGSEAVKSVRRNLRVVGPELSHHWTSQRDWKLWRILADAGSSIDILALHYYPDSDVELQNYLDRWIRPHLQGKPLWLTEVGEVACPQKKNSNERQASFYSSLLAAQATRNDWFQRIFPYRIWDPENTCNNGNGFGLTVGNWMEERAAYRTYRSFIAERPFKHRKRKDKETQ